MRAWPIISARTRPLHLPLCVALHEAEAVQLQYKAATRLATRGWERFILREDEPKLAR